MTKKTLLHLIYLCFTMFFFITEVYCVTKVEEACLPAAKEFSQPLSIEQTKHQESIQLLLPYFDQKDIKKGILNKVNKYKFLNPERLSYFLGILTKRIRQDSTSQRVKNTISALYLIQQKEDIQTIDQSLSFLEKKFGKAVVKQGLTKSISGLQRFSYNETSKMLEIEHVVELLTDRLKKYTKDDEIVSTTLLQSVANDIGTLAQLRHEKLSAFLDFLEGQLKLAYPKNEELVYQILSDRIKNDLQGLALADFDKTSQTVSYFKGLLTDAYPNTPEKVDRIIGYRIQKSFQSFTRARLKKISEVVTEIKDSLSEILPKRALTKEHALEKNIALIIEDNFLGLSQLQPGQFSEVFKVIKAQLEKALPKSPKRVREILLKRVHTDLQAFAKTNGTELSWVIEMQKAELKNAYPKYTPKTIDTIIAHKIEDGFRGLAQKDNIISLRKYPKLKGFVQKNVKKLLEVLHAVRQELEIIYPVAPEKIHEIIVHRIHSNLEGIVKINVNKFHKIISILRQELKKAHPDDPQKVHSIIAHRIRSDMRIFAKTNIEKLCAAIKTLRHELQKALPHSPEKIHQVIGYRLEKSLQSFALTQVEVILKVINEIKDSLSEILPKRALTKEHALEKNIALIIEDNFLGLSQLQPGHFSEVFQVIKMELEKAFPKNPKRVREILLKRVHTDLQAFAKTNSTELSWVIEMQKAELKNAYPKYTPKTINTIIAHKIEDSFRGLAQKDKIISLRKYPKLKGFVQKNVKKLLEVLHAVRQELEIIYPDDPEKVQKIILHRIHSNLEGIVKINVNKFHEIISILRQELKKAYPDDPQKVHSIIAHRIRSDLSSFARVNVKNLLEVFKVLRQEFKKAYPDDPQKIHEIIAHRISSGLRGLARVNVKNLLEVFKVLRQELKKAYPDNPQKIHEIIARRISSGLQGLALSNPENLLEVFKVLRQELKKAYPDDPQKIHEIIAHQISSDLQGLALSNPENLPEVFKVLRQELKKAYPDNPQKIHEIIAHRISSGLQGLARANAERLSDVIKVLRLELKKAYPHDPQKIHDIIASKIQHHFNSLTLTDSENLSEVINIFRQKLNALQTIDAQAINQLIADKIEKNVEVLFSPDPESLLDLDNFFKENLEVSDNTFGKYLVNSQLSLLKTHKVRFLFEQFVASKHSSSQLSLNDFRERVVIHARAIFRMNISPSVFVPLSDKNFVLKIIQSLDPYHLESIETLSKHNGIFIAVVDFPMIFRTKDIVAYAKLHFGSWEAAVEASGFITNNKRDYIRRIEYDSEADRSLKYTSVAKIDHSFERSIEVREIRQNLNNAISKSNSQEIQAAYDLIISEIQAGGNIDSIESIGEILKKNGFNSTQTLNSLVEHINKVFSADSL